MIDFEFTAEQSALQQKVRDYARKEIVPRVRKIDTEKKIPAPVLEGLAGLGLLGMTASTTHGGLGADPVTVGIVAEELAGADISCSIPTFFLVEAAWGYILSKYGWEERKREILAPVTKGKAFLGIAVTEPGGGSDVAAVKTTAVREGDAYRVNGSKLHISGVDEVMHRMEEGGGCVTLVKTDESKGVHGMSLLYIPLKNTEGVSFSLLEEWGRRGISAGALAFSDVKVPADYLIGEENKGFFILMEGFDYARAIISLVCCGSAMSALEQSMEYIKERHAFGNPIARFEGVQFRLADNWARLEAARLLGYKALWMYGRQQAGGPYSRFDVTRACAEAKLLAAPLAFEAINDAIQWHGAFGYTVKCPLELALKGVRSYFWAEGAIEIMRIIVARELLGKEFTAYR